MTTLRDLQIDYIDEHMSKRLPLFSKLYLYREQFLTNNADLITDICERMEDDPVISFFDLWKDKCYDYIIGRVDWDSLHQCKDCHKFYDDSDADNDKRFCSDRCEEVYEEVPDRGER